MDDVLAIILGGGRGTRLFPLTLQRSKPAVPIGGKYRLIDIPISNCLNSDLRRMFVLTQYNSESLNKHVAITYKFDVFSSAFVSILAAEQTEESPRLVPGHRRRRAPEPAPHRRTTGRSEVLILSGDQLYQMDYRRMLETPPPPACADVTVAVTPVTAEQASAFGILKMNQQGRIVHFDEKPPRERLADLGSEVPGRRHRRTWPRWASTCSTATLLEQRGRRTRSSSTSAATSSPKPVPAAARAGLRLPRLLGGRRDHPLLLPGQPRALPAGAAVRLLRRQAPGLHPPALPARDQGRALRRSRACWSRRAASCVDAEIERAVLGIRSRIGRGRRDPQTAWCWAPTTTRRSRRCGRAAAQRPAADGHRRRTPSSSARSWTRTRASAAACASSTRPASGEADGDGYFIREGIVIVPKNGCIRNGTVI